MAYIDVLWIIEIINTNCAATSKCIFFKKNSQIVCLISVNNVNRLGKTHKKGCELSKFKFCKSILFYFTLNNGYLTVAFKKSKVYFCKCLGFAPESLVKLN